MSEMVKKCLSKVFWYLFIAYIWTVANIYLIDEFKLKSKYLKFFKWLNEDGLLQMPNWWIIVIPLSLVVLGLVSKTTWQRFKLWGDRVNRGLFLAFCFSVSHYIALFPYIDESYISNLFLVIAYSFYGLFIVSVQRETNRRIEEERNKKDDQFTSKDLFERELLAEDISRDICNYAKEKFLNVAIYGDWGSGKTFLMRMLKEKFDKKKINTVWFDPWRYTDFNKMKRDLIVEIAKSLNGDNLSFIKFSIFIAEKLPFLKWVVDLISVKSVIAGDFVSLLLNNSTDTDQLKKRIGKHLQKLSKTDCVCSANGNDRNRRNNGNFSLIVFIDDLDRSKPEIVYQFFAELNQLLDIEGCCFIAGVDKNKVKCILKNKGFVDGEKFLVKLFPLKHALGIVDKSDEKIKLIESVINNRSNNEILEKLKELDMNLFDDNLRDLKQFFEIFEIKLKGLLSRWQINELSWENVLLGFWIKFHFPEHVRFINLNRSKIEDLVKSGFSGRRLEEAWSRDMGEEHKEDLLEKNREDDEKIAEELKKFFSDRSGKLKNIIRYMSNSMYATFNHPELRVFNKLSIVLLVNFFEEEKRFYEMKNMVDKIKMGDIRKDEMVDEVILFIKNIALESHQKDFLKYIIYHRRDMYQIADTELSNNKKQERLYSNENNNVLYLVSQISHVVEQVTYFDKEVYEYCYGILTAYIDHVGEHGTLAIYKEHVDENKKLLITFTEQFSKRSDRELIWLVDFLTKQLDKLKLRRGEPRFNAELYIGFIMNLKKLTEESLFVFIKDKLFLNKDGFIGGTIFQYEVIVQSYVLMFNNKEFYINSDFLSGVLKEIIANKAELKDNIFEYFYALFYKLSERNDGYKEDFIKNVYRVFWKDLWIMLWGSDLNYDIKEFNSLRDYIKELKATQKIPHDIFPEPDENQNL